MLSGAVGRLAVPVSPAVLEFPFTRTTEAPTTNYFAKRMLPCMLRKKTERIPSEFIRGRLKNFRRISIIIAALVF
jgi:hypothetical protein